MRLWVSRATAKRLVLAAICDGHVTGYQITRATGLGARRVYLALAGLEAAGMIADSWTSPPRERRLYRIVGTQ